MVVCGCPWLDFGHFYPRSPCGERPDVACGNRHKLRNFYPRSPCGERLGKNKNTAESQKFLSTLSLRRATCKRNQHWRVYYHFYPRSPCGERPRPPAPPRRKFYISIHALLAESDIIAVGVSVATAISIHALLAESDHVRVTTAAIRALFLSTLSLRRATVNSSLCTAHKHISIHALLAESDTVHQQSVDGDIDFYPRSPCGERRAKIVKPSPRSIISIHALLAESDGSRQALHIIYPRTFLSTLSLRRATS